MVQALQPKTEAEQRKEEYREELKQCAPEYRAPLKWAGIETQEQWEQRRERAVQSYQDGNYFFELLGMSRNFDPDMLAILIHLRQSSIEQYGITTAPEFMVLDATLLCYYHLIRLNTQIGNMEARINSDFFVSDEPKQAAVMKNGLIDMRHMKYDIEGLVKSTVYHTVPLLERFNKMLLRNLKALRDLKRMNVNFNIGRVGQMNVGETDVHITAEKDAQNTKNTTDP